MARDSNLLRSRAAWVLLLLAPLADCKCIEHPLYDAGVNRFDSWYLGGGNTQYRPFRSGELPSDAVLDVELALDRAKGGPGLVRALVVDAIDPDTLAGELQVEGVRVAVFEWIDDEQLVATLPAMREHPAELRAVFDDGHGTRLEIAVTADELRDALVGLEHDEEFRR